MRSFLFFIVFVFSVCAVSLDLWRESAKSSVSVCAEREDSLFVPRDTLKEVIDTSFCMSMQTNDPFKGKTTFVINLMSVEDSSCCFPLPNARVLSEFGPRGGRMHTGIDLKTFANDSIRAAFDGRVIKSISHPSYGNVILLRHKNGLETLYSHNSKNLVKTGDEVKVGQPVSLAGRTGRATTEHLHFECRIRDTRFDPNLLFDCVSQKLRYGYLKFVDLGGRVDVELVELERKRHL